MMQFQICGGRLYAVSQLVRYSSILFFNLTAHRQGGVCVSVSAHLLSDSAWKIMIKDTHTKTANTQSGFILDVGNHSYYYI